MLALSIASQRSAGISREYPRGHDPGVVDEQVHRAEALMRGMAGETCADTGGGAGDDGCAIAERVVCEGHQKWAPPSMRTSVPVMNLPSSEPSIATTDATVSGPA